MTESDLREAKLLAEQMSLPEVKLVSNLPIPKTTRG